MTREDPLRVLLVDDEPKARYAMCEMLAGLDVALVEAGSGEAALRALLEADFAVILLDVRLPGIDGYETARLIRERARSRRTPIIFLTGIEKTDELVLEGYAAGAVDYCFKPIHPHILRAKVEVFVELEKRTRSEARALSEARRLAEVEAMLEQYRAMGPGAVAQPMPGGERQLRQWVPQEYRRLVADYRALIGPYVEQLVVTAEKPASAMDALARRLGQLGAGARDVIGLHLDALEGAVRVASPSRAQALSVEGRLLALEMMGRLLDHYRLKCLDEAGRDQTDGPVREDDRSDD